MCFKLLETKTTQLFIPEGCSRKFIQHLFCSAGRLAFYDRNVTNEPVEPEFHMTLPDYNSYKDVHSGVLHEVPAFTLDRLHEYLHLYGKSFDDKCQEMYESR